MEQCRVLVVEDDETARKQLAKVIRKEGYEVLEAEDGNAGLALFRKEAPEIVITDLKMPGVDGLEVMHTVRQLSSRAQIILVTAFGETETAVAALREGAMDYLKKPLDLEALTVALGRAREKVMESKKAVNFPALLMADDEDKIRKRLARVLEGEGWKVFQAANGEEAIKVFEEQKIDVVILDIKMPKKNGLQALHEMRLKSDDFEAIILTGYGDESNAIQALRDGAINFLKKPIDLDQMILAVEKAMDKLKSERSLKYRTRELELATQIISTITDENQLFVDFRQHVPKPTREFAQQLLDGIPIALLVLDKNLKILYMNRSLSRVIEYQPEKVDEAFVKGLGKMGINKITCESLADAVDKIITSPNSAIKNISTGKYSFMTLVPLRIARDKIEENGVLLLLRGERP